MGQAGEDEPICATYYNLITCYSLGTRVVELHVSILPTNAARKCGHRAELTDTCTILTSTMCNRESIDGAKGVIKPKLDEIADVACPSGRTLPIRR